ncbi:DNA-3-methyladenine glycosylase I [Sphingomonas sp. CJ20]
MRLERFAAIGGARIYCEMAEHGESFADYCRSFTNGASIKNAGREWGAASPLSETISKDMRKWGFKCVGPTMVYAWMQAVGIVNDPEQDCFRRDATDATPSTP